MLGWGKNRLKLFYWQNSNKTKMASNNVINTELVERIVRGLKFISRLMTENIYYVDFKQKECTNIIYQKYIFQIKYFNLLFLSGHELPQVFQWLFFTLFDYF